jgi:hypothetical protein
MIVSSADLANSDKTDGFLKGTKILKKGDFSGAFLQAGVAELTMATLMNGIAAHGGVIPVCGTFFTFSDYMKPAVRLAALMGLPVKYVWSHDSFRVGEDGPTHQPVEHEAQIRLLEKMRTPEGHRRPSRRGSSRLSAQSRHARCSFHGRISQIFRPGAAPTAALTQITLAGAVIPSWSAGKSRELF